MIWYQPSWRSFGRTTLLSWRASWYYPENSFTDSCRMIGTHGLVRCFSAMIPMWFCCGMPRSAPLNAGSLLHPAQPASVGETCSRLRSGRCARPIDFVTTTKRCCLEVLTYYLVNNLLGFITFTTGLNSWCTELSATDQRRPWQEHWPRLPFAVIFFTTPSSFSQNW